MTQKKPIIAVTVKLLNPPPLPVFQEWGCRVRLVDWVEAKHPVAVESEPEEKAA